MRRAHAYVDDALLAALARACPRLGAAALDYCARVTSDGLAAFGRAAPGITRLSARSLPAAAGPGALACFPRLTSLDVSWVRAFDPATCLGPARLGQLAWAGLRGCERVGDADLASLAPALAHLDLAFTAVTDAGLAALAAGAAPGLATLTIAAREWQLWSCGAHSDAGLARFRAARPATAVVLVSS